MHFKKLILLAIIIIYCQKADAQFKLSGKVLNYNGKAKLMVNIPLVYGFYNYNSISIPIANDGTFDITFPIKETKLTSLIFEDKVVCDLLLQPSKTLTFNIKSVDEGPLFLAGTALPENKLMQDIGFDEPPFFFRSNHDDKPKIFNTFSFDELIANFVNPFKLKQQEKIKKVYASQIDYKDKQIISNEINYRSYYLLGLFTQTADLKKAKLDSLTFEIFNNVPLKSTKLTSGSYHYKFVRYYMRYIDTKLALEVKQGNIPNSAPLPYYGISFDSAMVARTKYGGGYIEFIGAIKNLPHSVVEPYFYQQITDLYKGKDLTNLSGLVYAFNKQFPNGVYYQDVNDKVVNLQKILSANASNKKIEIVEKISSLPDLIKPLRGKVIYLDVWGTWCGPCKEELQYIPELKSKFKGKDVVFVYLDMDEENKDVVWRDFIKVNNMEGIHFRKNRQTIAPFWKELLANAEDKAEYYPQYFIFDKEGKLVVTKAKRPSSKEELYAQLESYLR